MGRQGGFLIKPTLEECCTAAVNAGMPKREGEKMFVHYEMVHWRYGRGKVPIDSLALAVQNWKHGWEDRGCPGGGTTGAGGPVSNGYRQGNSNNGGSVPGTGINLVIKQKELERVMARIKVITNSYDSHMDLRNNDLREMVQLRKRRDDLKRELGVKF